VADQPWLLLGAHSGSTPQNVNFTVDPRGLGYGDHVATITFTSPEAPVPRVTVKVVLTVPEYDLYLPFVRRRGP
jgi:hypothetical protein